MPLLESVLLNYENGGQPFRSFLSELLLVLLIVPGRATFRNLSRYSDYVREKPLVGGLSRQGGLAGLNVAAISGGGAAGA